MNIISIAVTGITITAIILIVNGTFNHKYLQPSAQTLEAQAINSSDLKDLKGTITSIQYNASNSPDWIVTGRWKFFEIPSDSDSIVNSTSEKLNFNASLNMASIDGMENHRHKLNDFNLSKEEFHERNAIINGTVTLSTTGYDRGNIDKNITGVPISIKIMNLKTLSMQMDGKIAMDLFGSSPIYAKID